MAPIMPPIPCGMLYSTAYTVWSVEITKVLASCRYKIEELYCIHAVHMFTWIVPYADMLHPNDKRV